jgi:hypothetical protein
MPLDTPDRAIEHVAHFARPEVPQPPEDKIPLLLVPGAVQEELSGGNAAMISMQGGHFIAIPFAALLDPNTGRAKVRTVDIHSTRYAIARRYMIRLRRDDFEDPHELAKFAATAGLTLQEFRKEFEYLIAHEPPPLTLDAGLGGFAGDTPEPETAPASATPPAPAGECGAEEGVGSAPGEAGRTDLELVEHHAGDRYVGGPGGQQTRPDAAHPLAEVDDAVGVEGVHPQNG